MTTPTVEELENAGIKIPPMMKQYLRTKQEYMDCLLFYRMGDFYELFFDDAEIASSVLDIVLTYRGKLGSDKIKMCGVPFHAYESYLTRLVKAGYKVAICEQTEDPAEAKKRGSSAVVNREVIRIVTAGTLTEDALLNSRRHNFLMSIVAGATEYGIAWTDMSTGDFYTQTATDETIYSVLARLEVSEVLVFEDWYDLHPNILQHVEHVTTLPLERFEYMNNKEELCRFFNLADIGVLSGLTKSEQVAAGVIVGYVLQTQKGECPNFNLPTKLNSNSFMEIDVATRKSLELTTSLSGDKNATSLLKNIDYTVTGLGARMLSVQMSAPLLDVDAMNQRYDKIDYFLQNASIRENVRHILKEIGDIERAVSRLSVGRGGPRDMLSVGLGLSKIPELRQEITGAFIPESLLFDLKQLGEHSELVEEILNALPNDATDLPLLARDGGFIRYGYHAGLDELLDIKTNSHRILADLQYKYAHETGISNLKIQYNNIIGHYIEVTAKQADPLLVNKELGFIHRQTMVNNVRFTTVELTELEEKILHANEVVKSMELDLFEQLKQMVMAHNNEILTACHAIARIDIATSIALGAERHHWVRPIMTNDTSFDIQGGRHIVVERALSKERVSFVPNDCQMDGDKNRLWILTGPNMAGKSTFLRQNALMAILAQMGCFVPAEYAKIGVVDKLFSRVGASDDLARGRSTFMVEMVEVASILKGATEKSLVILDEVGRGTATYDGLSIAWAVVEYLHDTCRCRGLFATHYHELTALVNRLTHISLHTMRVKEWKGEIVFMHEIAQGAVDRSYGIHVGKLAGLPTSVVHRAEQILEQLEEKRQEQKPLFDDLPLFSQISQTTSIHKESAVEKQLKSIDIDLLSPREALDLIYRLKELTEVE